MLLTFSTSDAHTARPSNLKPKSFSDLKRLDSWEQFAGPKQIGSQERWRTNTTNKIKPMPGRYNAAAGSGIGLVESIE